VIKLRENLDCRFSGHLRRCRKAPSEMWENDDHGRQTTVHARTPFVDAADAGVELNTAGPE